MCVALFLLELVCCEVQRTSVVGEAAKRSVDRWMGRGR